MNIQSSKTYISGVFGILSLMGTDLDPIVMSAAIMSIGFSVDIPAHISYHFYKTGLGLEKQHSVKERLAVCITSIGFPVLEAGVSTIICVSSLMWVDLHMARVFARTLMLVVLIGLVHGLLVIPVMLYLTSLIRRGKDDSIIVISNVRSSYQIHQTSMTASSSMACSTNGILTINLAATPIENKQIS